MPIFMDRHDMRGTKAEEVAEAHRRDVDIQDRHGVKYMAYWFDEDSGSAFCLVHAPDAATAERVHREAHGEIANAIIPVDLLTVEAFLGRISNPRAAPGAAAPAVDPGRPPGTSGSDDCGRSCMRRARARSPRSARRDRRARLCDRSRSPT